MARFYGTLVGRARTPATRCGTAVSGMVCHIRGWDVGVEVHAETRPHRPDEDVFHVYMTGGSNAGTSPQHIGSVRLNSAGEPVYVPNIFRNPKA